MFQVRCPSSSSTPCAHGAVDRNSQSGRDERNRSDEEERCREAPVFRQHPDQAGTQCAPRTEGGGIQHGQPPARGAGPGGFRGMKACVRSAAVASVQKRSMPSLRPNRIESPVNIYDAAPSSHIHLYRAQRSTLASQRLATAVYCQPSAARTRGMIIQTWSRRSCRSNTEYAAQRHLTPLSGRSWPDSRARTVPISPSSQTMISSASAIADNRLRASGWHFCRMAQSGRANWARWRPEVALGVVRCR